jgi:hypothetical protein
MKTSKPGNKVIVEKVRKLLMLASSANEHEAAVAAAKVVELLSKYNLEMSSVAQEDDALKASRIHRKTRQKLERWAYLLASKTAKVFDCEYYHSQEEGQTVFVGMGADPEVCGWMFSYLYRTLLRLAATHMRTVRKRLRSSATKKKAKDSFLVGAVGVVTEKLERQKMYTPVTSDALVPVKTSAIAAAMPPISSRPCKTGKVDTGDWTAGRRAASSIPLSTPIKNSVPQREALTQ